MRYLTTLLLAALSLNAVGQGIPQLPYNPDATEDGFIGSPDLLELLSLYGEEFSSAILSEDEESAIVYMGQMAHPVCTQACDNLPGFWNMATMHDLGLVWNEVMENSSTWVNYDANESYNTTVSGIYDYNFFNPYIDGGSLSASYTPSLLKRCYCAAHELPKVEYSYCSGGTPDNESFVGCINEKLTEGWYPLSGWPIARDRQGYVYGPTNLSQTYGAQTHASFWRWAE